MFHKKPVHLSALSGLQASNNVDGLMKIKGSYVYNGDLVMILFCKREQAGTDLEEVESDNVHTHEVDPLCMVNLAQPQI